MMTKILCGNFEKMASRKIFQHFLHDNFFMFILLISSHVVFLVQFEINLLLRVFQKAEIALSEDIRPPVERRGGVEHVRMLGPPVVWYGG